LLRITEILGEEELNLIKSFFSLSEYEARIYLALAILGPMGISRLAEVSGVPRTKCYSVARSLISKGMAFKTSSKPFIVSAIDPEALPWRIAEDRCREAKDKASQVVQSIRRIRDSLGRGATEEAERLDLAGIIIISSINDLVASLARDMEKASKEVLIAISKAPIKFPWRDLMIHVINALARGVVIEYAVPKDSSVAKHLKLLIEGSSSLVGGNEGGGLGSYFERLRIRESLYAEAPFIVIDDEIVYNIFTDPARGVHLFTIRSRNSAYARSMRIYFDLLTTGAPTT